MSPTIVPVIEKSITLAQRYTSQWFYLGTSIPPPSSPYAVSLNPTTYSNKYYCIHLVRKQNLFRLRDSPLASLFRMYEMLLCGLNDKLGAEVEYFYHRKWRISSIPNPNAFGWESDLDRDRICQLIVIQLVEAFNYYKFNRQTPSKVLRTQKLPIWANTLDVKYINWSEVYERFPGLQKAYFFLPWKEFLMVKIPMNRYYMRRYHEDWTSTYLHWSKMHSLPLFRQKDTLHSSFLRLYELKVLTAVDVEMQQIYQSELHYMLNRWRVKVAEYPDPRSRWGIDKFRYEMVLWDELLKLVKELAELEIRQGRGLGLLPKWAREEVQGAGTTGAQAGGSYANKSEATVA